MKHPDINWATFKELKTLYDDACRELTKSQEEAGRYQEALEHIKTVTARGNKEFRAFVDGAMKVDEPELIEYAKDGDALASLVYNFADKALTVQEKENK